MNKLVLITLLCITSCTNRLEQKQQPEQNIVEGIKTEECLRNTNEITRRRDFEIVAFDSEPKELTNREFALKICLTDNYRSLGIYPNKLSDFSPTKSPFYPEGMEKQRDFFKFIKINTKDFYKEDQPLKGDGDTAPFNAIFSRCMEFYNSEELQQYIKENEL